jgi:hypothetical protein
VEELQEDIQYLQHQLQVEQVIQVDQVEVELDVLHLLQEEQELQVKEIQVEQEQQHQLMVVEVEVEHPL